MLSSNAMLPLIIALPFIAAGAVLTVGRAGGARTGWIVVGGALASTAALVRVATTGGPPIVFTQTWMPALQVRLALRGDPFGVFLALLVATIGVLVALYSLVYMAGEAPDRLRRYYATLAAFMGAMLGIALADDLVLLFVFWEITSVTSFLLIGFRSEQETARAGAVTALLVTALGGLVMSVGFLLVGIVTGTFSISDLAANPALAGALRSPLGDAALLLILCGAFTKSAQVPFHFWLPRAMVAPTPISAYLHAATMVKAGVFLLGRMLPIFGGSPLWMPTLVGVGTVSMLLGAFQALRETDLKAILARSTASMLGLITLLYGIGAAEQDALQMLSHALYKGALFLVAGIVEHHAHTRNIDELGGLRRALPIAFGVAVLAALSMAGLPPLLGFVAKESFYGALLHGPVLAAHPLVRAVVVAASIAASACTVAVAWMLVARVFLGAPRRVSRAAEPGSGIPLWPAPALLAGAALALGILSMTPVTGDLVRALASRAREHLHVALVPHVDLALGASLLALGLAVPLYHGRDSVRRLVLPLSAGRLWDAAIAGVARAAETLSRGWQNGSLHRYLAVTALSAPVLALYVLHRGGLSYRHVQVSMAETPWYGLLLCALLAVATVTAVRADTRLGAAIATTTIGYLVSMLFVVYRSPDILLTQILIETVSTIFIVLVLIFLPSFPRRDLSPTGRAVNLGIASVFGVVLMMLLLLSMTPGLREAVNIATRPGGLLSLSLAQGGGANAVNVIIVDIRAMDTNGEITVLVVVGLCVYGLLRARRNPA